MCVYLSSEICARTQKKFRGQNLEVCEGIIHIFNGHYLNIVAFHLVFLFNRFKNKMRMTRNFGPEELGRWGGAGEGVLIFGGRTKGWGWGGRGRAARRGRISAARRSSNILPPNARLNTVACARARQSGGKNSPYNIDFGVC